MTTIDGPWTVQDHTGPPEPEYWPSNYEPPATPPDEQETPEPITGRRSWRWASELLDPWQERVQTQQEHIPSPWPQFNEDFSGGGFLPHRIVTIAAPTGFGKSVAGIQIAGHAAECGYSSAIFSAEMSKLDVFDRVISRKARVPLTAIEKRDLEDWNWRRFHAHHDDLAELPLIIDDADGLSVEYVVDEARAHYHGRGVRLFVLDYIQLLNAKAGGATREQEVAYISRRVKALAQELPVVIVQLAQLNQQGAVRESQQIANDSNLVITMRKPEEDGEESPYVEMVIQKNRNGRKGVFRTLFSGAYADLAPDEGGPHD